MDNLIVFGQIMFASVLVIYVILGTLYLAKVWYEDSRNG